MELGYSFYTRPFSKGFDAYDKSIRVKAFLDFIIFKYSLQQNLKYFDTIHIVCDELGKGYLKNLGFLNDKRIVVHNVLDNLIENDYGMWTYGKIKAYQYLGVELNKPFIHIDQDAWFNHNPLPYINSIKPTLKSSVLFQSPERCDIGKYLEFSEKLRVADEVTFKDYFISNSNIAHCFSIYGVLDKEGLCFSNEYCESYYKAISHYSSLLIPANTTDYKFEEELYSANNWYNIIFEQMLGSLYFQNNPNIEVLSILQPNEYTPATTADNSISGFKHLWGDKNNETKMLELIKDLGDLNLIDKLKHLLNF